MALPKYYEFYSLFLSALKDRDVHSIKELQTSIASSSHLSDDALQEMLPSGKQSVFKNRIGWTRTYLKKAGMIDSPKKGYFVITDAGFSLLNSGKEITDEYLAQLSPAFAEFKYGHRTDSASQITVTAISTVQDDETPEETLERVYADINKQLCDDLLTEIMHQSPAFFEQLVVNLMVAMNYGNGFVTKYSGDDGIDGIIHEDKLGFNLIYIQAKRWQPSITIGKPELQKFAGAMMGPPRVGKGLFITTAKFSQSAKDFANAQHIILVDGQKLTELMVEYDLGVSTQKVYKIKRIDSDYFSDED